MKAEDFKDITILIDKREKDWRQRVSQIRGVGIKAEARILLTADYSYEVNGNSMESNFLIERKSGDIEHGGGWGELCTNLRNKVERVIDGENYNVCNLEAEFIRAKGVESMVLIIENADKDSWHDIKRVTYKQGDYFRTNFKNNYDGIIMRTNARRRLKGNDPLNIMFKDKNEFISTLLELVYLDYIKRLKSENSPIT